MPLFTWHPRYSVGVPKMDAEHARLFALADQLHADLGQGASQKTLCARFEALFDFARAHFAHEEQIMARHGYPEITRHQAEHGRLTEKALELQRDIAAGRNPASARTLLFLRDWLHSHIDGPDRDLAAYLQSKGVVGAKPTPGIDKPSGQPSSYSDMRDRNV